MVRGTFMEVITPLTLEYPILVLSVALIITAKPTLHRGLGVYAVSKALSLLTWMVIRHLTANDKLCTHFAAGVIINDA